MKKKTFGFTLIEVSFFIAITGLLFVGIIVGTQSSIWQQKYNDSVQSFTDFLRNVYAEVSSVQGVSDGRSDKALYGKMISFGQEVGLDGGIIPEGQQVVFVYDVMGNAMGGNGNSINQILASLEINALMETESGGAGYVGIVESYMPIWGAAIEGTDPGSNYKGTVLIIRNPNTGLINTLVSKKIININEEMKYRSDNYDKVSKLLTSVLNLDSGQENAFRVQEVNFCLNPYGSGQTGTLRRNIRLIKNAKNASGVEIIDLVDDSRNACANK